jgi:hypothetical protein
MARHSADARLREAEQQHVSIVSQADNARRGLEASDDVMGSEKFWEGDAALTSRLQTFETNILTLAENFAGLERINRELIARVETVDSRQRMALDMDLTEITEPYTTNAPIYAPMPRSLVRTPKPSEAAILATAG